MTSSFLWPWGYLRWMPWGVLSQVLLQRDAADWGRLRALLWATRMQAGHYDSSDPSSPGEFHTGYPVRPRCLSRWLPRAKSLSFIHSFVRSFIRSASPIVNSRRETCFQGSQHLLQAPPVAAFQVRVKHQSLRCIDSQGQGLLEAPRTWLQVKGTEKATAL